MSPIQFDEPWTFGGHPWRSLKDTSVGVIVADTQGEIIYANERAMQLHGGVRLEVGPDDYSRMHGLFTEDGRPYAADDLPLTRAVRRGETVRHAHWVVRRPDGSRNRLQGSAYPVCNRDGKQVAAVLVHDALETPESE